MLLKCLFTAILHLQQKLLNATLEEINFFNETPVLIHVIIWLLKIQWTQSLKLLIIQLPLKQPQCLFPPPSCNAVTATSTLSLQFLPALNQRGK